MTGLATADPAAGVAAGAAIGAGRPVDGPSEELARQLERHRPDLTARCRRMLRSTADAEDAVQETLLRAWRGFDRFEGRAELRTWLRRIAVNICLDMIDKRRRTARPVDPQPVEPDGAGARSGFALSEAAWNRPLAGSRIVPPSDDPADVTVETEAIRQAFLALLLHLPPRQRAVLVLREVLRWPARDVAELLGTTVAGVNSALQRARAALVTCDPSDPSGGEGGAEARGTEARDEVVSRYVDAFARYDIGSLVSLVASSPARSPARPTSSVAAPVRARAGRSR